MDKAIKKIGVALGIFTHRLRESFPEKCSETPREVNVTWII